MGEFGRPLDGHYIYGLDSGKRRKMAISQDNPYGALEKESDDLHGQVLNIFSTALLSFTVWDAPT